MADETSLVYEDPRITKEVRDAIRRFRASVEYEKELCHDPHMIQRMGHFAKSKVLDSLIDFEEPGQIVKYLDDAVRNLQQYRAQPHVVSNPIRIFKREPEVSKGRKAG